MRSIINTDKWPVSIVLCNYFPQRHSSHKLSDSTTQIYYFTVYIDEEPETG